MSSNQESDSHIFPLLNRRAPILERIRGNRANDNEVDTEIEAESEALETLGKVVAKFSLTGEEATEEQKQAFRQGIADGLGIESDEVGEDAVTAFEQLFELEIPDITIAEEEIGQEDEEEEEETEASDEDSSLAI